MMFDIQGVIVSSELASRYFCCNIDACLGACCIEGDSGAPITEEEYKQLKELLPEIWPDLLPSAQREIEESGIAFRDQEGELVTNLVEGRNCVFSCYSGGGVCQCAIQQAHAQGRVKMLKPMSCYLYPLRIKQYPNVITVNYDRWKICKPAEVYGRQKNIRLYEFTKQPLIARFGQEWYDELELACKMYIEQYLGE